ncbi:nucleotidyltransferase family protein [Phenylobacterium deserti]|uniref:Nucleotidyltransferase family protein n=2 Tax=Phenylobacterium deserti TaxID=1914756 RepID=A0A328AS12_9CAUL|nr:nucleotidyltransferase family protein [Phenylobacterium deserti]
MVLAAGLGTRMRPLTDTMPKALVPVGGRALIDRVLDRLVEAGVERAVVNVHYLADQMVEHLGRRSDLEILISDERDELLDSGGGIQHARPLLGEEPIFLANIDSLWVDRGEAPLETLKRTWNPDAMDLLLLLVRRGDGIGFEGPQGFLMDDAGRLTHSTSLEVVTPFANVGFGIMKPQVLDDQPKSGAFPIQPTWRRLQSEGRLFGAVMDAFWMHVGDPAARGAAEARLK